MLFRELDKIKRNIIMTSILLMFVGMILLITPAESVMTLTHAIGYVLLVMAVLAVFHFLESGKMAINFIRLFGGLFAGLIGLMIFTFEEDFLEILGFLFGIIPVLGGIYMIIHAATFARRSGRKGWWILILLAAGLIGCGDVILLNPWKGHVHALLQLMGGTLLFSSLLSLLRLIWVWSPGQTAEEPEGSEEA